MVAGLVVLHSHKIIVLFRTYVYIVILANLLANVDCRAGQRIDFVGRKDLPRKLKGFCMIDKMGLPNFKM